MGRCSGVSSCELCDGHYLMKRRNHNPVNLEVRTRCWHCKRHKPKYPFNSRTRNSLFGTHRDKNMRSKNMWKREFETERGNIWRTW